MPTIFVTLQKTRLLLLGFTLLTLVGMQGTSFAQNLPVQLKPDPASLPSTSNQPAQINNRSRLLIEQEMNESLVRAKNRLNSEAGNYADYLEQRLRLEQELRLKHASELRSFQAQMLEAARNKQLAELHNRQIVLIENLQTKIKAEQEAMSAAVLEFEAQQRRKMLESISQKESLMHAELSSLQRGLESRVLNEVQVSVAERAGLLQDQLTKRLNDLDREYRLNGRILSSVNPRSDQTQSAATATNSAAPKAQSSGPTFHAGNQTTTWTVQSQDQTVRATLIRWAALAGWSLAWESDLDLPIMGDRSFNAPLTEAIDQLLTQSVQQGDRLDVSLFQQNRVIRVQRRY